MASIGKKILSAFVEVNDNKKTEAVQLPGYTPAAYNNYDPTVNSKFKDHFDKLFKEADIKRPDYFEFSKMTDAMQAVTDEQIRYITAFAGLSVQGLDKQKLLTTALQYLQLLETDATNFHNMVDAALQEKVHEKQQQLEEKAKHIHQLTQEINTLQTSMQNLQVEIKENEEKIQANMHGYIHESGAMKDRINRDMEKINRYIQ